MESLRLTFAKGGTTWAHTGSQDIFGDNIVVFLAFRALIMVSVCRQMTYGVECCEWGNVAGELNSRGSDPGPMAFTCVMDGDGDY